MKERAPTDRDKIARRATATASVAAVGAVVALYGMSHTRVGVSQEAFETLECSNLNNLADVINDPEAGRVEVENATYDATLTYMFGADTDGDGKVDVGGINEDPHSQVAYDAVIKAGEFSDELPLFGELSEKQRQEAAAPYLVDLTDIIDQTC